MTLDDFCQTLLVDYNPLEWPDLSAERRPADLPFTIQGQLTSPPAAQTVSNSEAVAIAALARITGEYCNSSDILLGIQLDERDRFNVIRVTWNQAQTWNEVAILINQRLQNFTDEPTLTLPDLQRVLGFNDKQTPCLPLIRFFASGADQSLGFPFVVSFDSTHSKFHFSSNRQRLHPSVVSVIIQQFTALIEYVFEHLTSLISVLPPLPNRLLSICERTSQNPFADPASYSPKMRLITDYVAQRAANFPDATAICWYPDLVQDIQGKLNFESLTYADLHRGANRLARWLINLGLNREDRVAICMPRNLMFHVAMIGLMRAGGCYVPIDPELPPERKNYIVRDSSARFVLSSEESGMTMLGPVTILIESDAIQESIREQSDETVDLASPKSLAYLLYTSGTTGTPKGCLLTHEGFAEAIWALSTIASDVRMEDLTRGKYLAVASIAFDVHLAEIFVPIALGMPLLSAPRSILFESLPHYIKVLGITHVGIVPSLIEATMGAVQDGKGNNGMALRYIASGGEKMSDTILEKWANHPEVKLANFYGPSEVTIGCCARFMETNTPRANIGRPFPNVSAYVVDKQMNILLQGGIGELVVEGPLVARGYHGRPDLTEKVFLEWPEKGKWTYRTGDLVRMMPDQTLEILGRIDTQIKLRGVRIESEGVSSIVRSSVAPHPGFNLDAVTILAKHPAIGSEQLISFISWDSTITVSTRKSSKPRVVTPPDKLLQTIREVCDKELASYMRPSHLIPLSWLPLSSNGKSDVKQLGGIFLGLNIEILTWLMTSDAGKAYAQRPLTATEREIVSVIERHSNFAIGSYHPRINLFECGMDSMSIIRLTADLKAQFSRPISVSDIMKAPTVEAIALNLEETLVESRDLNTRMSYVKEFSSRWLDVAGQAYPPHEVERVFPPFPIQEGILYRSADNGTMYLQHVIVECKDNVSLPNLRSAWQSVTDRHSILRTVFLFDKALIQVVLLPNVSPLPWTENKTSIATDESFVQWFLLDVAPEKAKNINESLSTIPPFRIQIYTSPTTTYMAVSIHHALFDGISLPLLFRDVEQEYFNRSPRPPADFSDLLDSMAMVNTEKARKFWIGIFHDFNWPSKSLKLTSANYARSIAVPFKSPLSFLKDSAAAQQVTLQALLTCAFANLLATLIYNCEDVTFGVIRSGRLLPVDGIETALCPMISVLPARVNFSDAVHNIVRRIQRDISDVVEFENVPLGRIQKWIRPGEDIFEVLFSVSVKENLQSDLWEVSKSEPPQPDFVFSVEVVVDPDEDTLLVQALWTEGDLPHTVVQNFMNNFEGVALGIAKGHFTGLGVTPQSPNPAEESRSHTDGTEAFLGLHLALIMRLRKIIAEYLSVEENLLADTTSFLVFGLDSIKSVALGRNLRNAGMNVYAVDLMRYPTLRQLANYITQKVPEIPGNGQVHGSDSDSFSNMRIKIMSVFDASSAKFDPHDEIAVYPTTVLQAGMLSQTVGTHGKLYVHGFPLRLTESIDVGRLHRAWKTVAQKLSMLRTSFHFLPDLGIWVQVVHSSDHLGWSEDVYQSLDDYEEKLLRFSSVTWSEVEDFRYPPFRICLLLPGLDMPDRQGRLILMMHHALYDGLSITKLLDTIQAIYFNQELSNITQFVDLLGHFFRQEQMGASFWVPRLRDNHCLRLNRLSFPEDSQTAYAASRTIYLDRSLTENFVRHAAVTLQSLVQTAWAKLMCALTTSTDIVFGHVVSGRNISGAEDVIGPVLNTIPCRVRIIETMRNADLLRSIHEANIEALPWQQASLRSIQKELGVSSLWDSLFLFQPIEALDIAPDQNSLWEFEETEEEARIQYPINVEVHQRDFGFIIKAACLSDYMESQQLIEALQRFEQLLGNLIEKPNNFVLKDVTEVSSTSLEYANHQERKIRANETDEDDLHIPDMVRNLLSSVTNFPAQHITPGTSLLGLGIDSITAIQIVAKCRKLGMELTASDVIESQTVNNLLRKIDQHKVRKIALRKIEVDINLPENDEETIVAHFDDEAANAIEAITIATSGMKWLIGAWQRSEGTRFQHAFAYSLPDEVNIPKLRDAWTDLLDRHSILRSTFGHVSGKADPCIVTFKSTALASRWSEEVFSDDLIFEGVLQKMRSLTTNPLILSRPPTKALLLSSPQHRYLVLYLHHFQYDAWSLQILMNDLSGLYYDMKPTSSNDLRGFLRLYAPNHESLMQQQHYWNETLPVPFYPELFPSLLEEASSEYTPGSTRRTIYTVKNAITRASSCEERARSWHVSLQAIFLACWARLQGQYTSSDSSTFGLWHSGRTGTFDNIAKVAIPCMNVLPFHVSGIYEGTIIDLAKRVQQDLRRRSALIEQSDLNRVDEWVGGGGKPLCNVYVNIVKIAPEIDDSHRLLEPHSRQASANHIN